MLDDEPCCGTPGLQKCLTQRMEAGRIAALILQVLKTWRCHLKSWHESVAKSQSALLPTALDT